MKYYLLLIWGDMKPGIAGPFETEGTRSHRALEIKKEYDNNPDIFMLDIDDKGHPYFRAYSNGFFEREVV